jgi:hypothetical protein
MVEAIYDSLGAALARWTMGGTAAPLAPAAWTAQLGTDPAEAELRLLALSGQFLDALVTAEPLGIVQMSPDVPVLTMPTLPETLRALARRILRTMRETRQRRDLLAFVAARGWTLHPGDWMPSTSEDDIPDVYAPWRDWVEGLASPAKSATAGALTAENWDDYWPAARNVALAALRRRDAAAATALLAAKLGGENAEARLRLVGMLATGLSNADRAFLESLASDRAPKVKALAAALLARLGHGPAAGEEATELAGFFEIQTKGLLRRTRIVAARTLKTAAQRSRRLALFDSVDLAPFAQALDSAPGDLIGAWPWGDDRQADHGRIVMTERSGSDEMVAASCAALGATLTIDVQAVLALLPRLDAAQRQHFAARVLGANGGTFQMALTIAGGDAPIDGAIDTAAGAALLGALKTDETGKRADLTAELNALGLVASRPAAKSALDRLASAGLLAADPRLDMLRLNAALDDRGTG